MAACRVIGSGDFCDGAIVKIRLEDFLTYDRVEIRPGPRLNVVVGANATGKSTIINAICLGLGGHQSILGRAQHLGAFIKHGKERAIIEIELCNSAGENYKVRREIYPNDKSNWIINGKATTMKSVTELTKRLNIQVGNLCQFLPQDRVADFIKMSKQELFESTEKAVNGELYEMHKVLKEAQQRASELRSQCERTTARLEAEKQQNASLENDVHNYEQRRVYEERVRLLKMKRPWVEYENQRKLYVNEKEKKTELEQRLCAAQKQLEPWLGTIRGEQAAEKELHASVRNVFSRITKARTAATVLMRPLEECDKKIEELQDNLSARKREEMQRQKKVHDLGLQLAALKSEMKEAKDPQTIIPLVKELTDEMAKYTQELTVYNTRLESLMTDAQLCRAQINALERRITRIQDVDSQRLNILRVKDKHTYEAVLWLRSNKSSFKKVIHEPPVLTLKLKCADDAMFIESHIPFKDMRMFVCEDAEDMEKFYRDLRETRGLSINAALAPRESAEDFCPKYSITELRTLGFLHYLKDTFDAPAAVMAYLCRNFNVHCVPVGTNQVSQSIDTIASMYPDLRRFYSKDTNYVVRFSKYGNRNRSVTATSLRNSGLLVGVSEDIAEQELSSQMQPLQHSLKLKEQKLEEAKSACVKLKSLIDTVRQRKKDLVQQQHQRQNIEEKIRHKELGLDRLKESAADLNGEEAKAVREVAILHERKLQHLHDAVNHITICVKLVKEHTEASFSTLARSMKIKQLESELHGQKAAVFSLQQELTTASERFDVVRTQAKRFLEIAQRFTKTEKPTDDMKKMFDALPSTLEEIDASITDEQSRADLIFHVDAEVVRAYNYRKSLIEKLTEQLAQEQKNCVDHQQEVEQVKEKWKEPVIHMMDTVNKAFSRFFKFLNCAGEVELAEPADPEKYDSYGVAIRVKFGDTILKDLTTFQSGGERSVATILYILSLQEVSRTPFRCVDEINQGMDAENERKIFELMVKAASKEATPQCFLLTPKLLPNLLYSDHMSILCVLNGPHVAEYGASNLQKYIQRHKASRRGKSKQQQPFGVEPSSLQL